MVNKKPGKKLTSYYLRTVFAIFFIMVEIGNYESQNTPPYEGSEKTTRLVN